MNHRIVTLVVGLIIAILVAASFAFAWAVQARVPASAMLVTPMTIPHPIVGRTHDCTSCHDGAGVPLTHRHFSADTCQSCHPRSVAALVPHSVSMGDSRCPLCHGNPHSSHRVSRTSLAFKDTRCLLCHDGDSAKASIEPKPAGESARTRPTLTHPTSGAFTHCLYCHRIGSTPSLPIRWQ